VLAAKPDYYGLGVIPPTPTWFDPVEPQSKCPLMLCSRKSRARTHSIHGNQPQLARVDPDASAAIPRRSLQPRWTRP
jgi:hypothetical protein